MIGLEGPESSGSGHRGTIARVMPRPTLRQLLFCLATGFLVSSPTLMLGGCSGNPPPAAASNENFTASGATSAPGMDDRWASIVLDAAQQREVQDALRDAVFGETPPFRAAEFGVRFEDVPRAILIAAPTVEMAVMKQTFVPSIASLTFLDPSGQEAVASIVLGRMTAIARVKYLVPGDNVSERTSSMLDAINGLLWSNDIFFAGSSVDRRVSARAGVEGVQAVRILEAAVKKSGGTPLVSAFEPEKYRIDLLMLDDQPARIDVRREPDPTVLSWKAWAGTFSMPAKAAALGAAFDDALREWGRIPSPIEIRDVATDQD